MSVLITDPITVLLDPVTGDLPNGPLVEATGFAAATQGAKVRLSICAGECFTNLDQGVRYRQRPGVPASLALLGQKFSRPKALNEFRVNLLGDAPRGILPIPGIVSLPGLGVTFNVDTREMPVTFQATFEFGDTPADTLTVQA